MNFFRISRQIPEKSDVCRFSIKFAKTNSKIAEIFEICENKNYSILFNFIQSCPYADHHAVHAGGAPLATDPVDAPEDHAAKLRAVNHAVVVEVPRQKEPV